MNCGTSVVVTVVDVDVVEVLSTVVEVVLVVITTEEGVTPVSTKFLTTSGMTDFEHKKYLTGTVALESQSFSYNPISFVPEALTSPHFPPAVLELIETGWPFPHHKWSKQGSRKGGRNRSRPVNSIRTNRKPAFPVWSYRIIRETEGRRHRK